MAMTALSLACVALPWGPWMSVPALMEPSLLNLKALVSGGMRSLSWIFCLKVDFGTEGRSWICNCNLSNNPSNNPSDPSDLSASVAATAGINPIVAVAAAGLSSPSDSSSQTNFNSFSFQAGFCNDSATLLRISMLLDAAVMSSFCPRRILHFSFNWMCCCCCCH